jgi:hypothetical protein
VTTDPQKAYIETMDRTVRQAVGLTPGGRLAAALQQNVPKLDIGAGLKATLDVAARGAMLNNGLRETLDAAARGAVLNSGLKGTLDAAAKGAVLSSGVKDVLGATAKGAMLSSGVKGTLDAAGRGVRIDGALRQLFDSMEVKATALGRPTRWTEQLEALARPLAGTQLDPVTGKNAAAFTATREALAETSTLAAYGQAFSALARRADLNPAEDVSLPVERLRLATETAERIAPTSSGLTPPQISRARSLTTATPS